MILHEINTCVPARQRRGIYPYGPNSRMEPPSTGPIPSWDPAPERLVPSVIPTNASRCINTKADQRSGVVRIRRKNDANSIVRGMMLATRPADAIQAQTNPVPVETSIPRGS